MLQDLKHSFRIWIRDPSFTLIAVSILALGIASTTAVFSVVNGILLRPFPYHEPERLVVLWERQLTLGLPKMFASPPNFADWSRETETFESLAAYNERDFVFEADSPERVSGTQISASLLPLLGVEPLAGRVFLPEEDQPGAERVVVLSHGFWQRVFGGRPAVGETLTLDSEPYTIVGIMPPSFSFPPQIALEGNLSARPSELWVPFRVDYAAGQRTAHFMTVVGRLASGVSLEEARADLERVASALEAAYPESNQGWDTEVVALAHEVTGDLRPALGVLMAAVGLVLLVACANIASLLLGRGLERSREMAVRASLGAPRARLLRQVLIESFVLALFSGIAGLAIAGLGVKALLAAAPSNLPRLSEVSLDGRAALCASLACLLSGLLFGIFPAVRLSALDRFDRLKTRAGGAAGATSARNTLVVIEIALASTLLVGAGLLVRSFINLRGVDPGFRAVDALVFSANLPPARYRENAERVQFLERALAELEVIPGVAAVGAVNEMPLAHDRQGTSFLVAGEPEPEPGKESMTNFAVVSPDYFEALRVPLVRGRFFDQRDRLDAPPVVLVNETFARRYFPDRDPVGTRIAIGMSMQVVREIVGIVGDVRHRAIAEEALPNVYAPYLQYPRSYGLTFVVRTAMSPDELASQARQALARVDRTLPVFDLRPVAEIVRESTSRPRFETSLLTFFALSGLLLAAVGLYGLVSYSVSRRTPEIGLRMALGADASKVRDLVVGEGVRLGLLGVGLGLAGSLGLSRFLSSLLFGIDASDFTTFGLAALVLFGVALLSSYLPARRAMRIAPIEALRHE